MEIRVCQNKKEWDGWFLKQESNNFLQSFNWGEFQNLAGHPAWRLQIVEGEEVLWQGQGFEHKLGLGVKYLYVSRFQIDDLRFKIICDFLKEKGFVFLRAEPINAANLQSSIFNLQFTHNRQPQTTLMLDLAKTEEELLQEMHAKTRYNIHLAEKKFVKIVENKDADIFWQLNQATSARDKFKSHDEKYYATMLKFDFVKQLTAYYNDLPIASCLFVVFGDTLTYLHGASSDSYRNLMAPYLLQWEGIKLGKKIGCKYFDFWGIAPKIKEGEVETCFNNLCWKVDHKWTGVTRFKVGFGGSSKEYPQATEVVLNKWKYFIYKMIKKIKK